MAIANDFQITVDIAGQWESEATQSSQQIYLLVYAHGKGLIANQPIKFVVIIIIIINNI